MFFVAMTCHQLQTGLDKTMQKKNTEKPDSTRIFEPFDSRSLEIKGTVQLTTPGSHPSIQTGGHQCNRSLGEIPWPRQGGGVGLVKFGNWFVCRVKQLGGNKQLIIIQQGILWDLGEEIASLWGIQTPSNTRSHRFQKFWKGWPALLCNNGLIQLTGVWKQNPSDSMRSWILCCFRNQTNSLSRKKVKKPSHPRHPNTYWGVQPAVCLRGFLYLLNSCLDVQDQGNQLLARIEHTQLRHILMMPVSSWPSSSKRSCTCQLWQHRTVHLIGSFWLLEYFLSVNRTFKMFSSKTSAHILKEAGLA